MIAADPSPFSDSPGTLESFALPRAPEVDPGEDHRQLRRPQLDAAGPCRGGDFEAPRLESLDLGITMPSFSWRYTNSVSSIDSGSMGC